MFHVVSQPLAYGPLEEQPPLPPRVRRLDNLRLDSSDVPAWQGEALPIRFWGYLKHPFEMAWSVSDSGRYLQSGRWGREECSRGLSET